MPPGVQDALHLSRESRISDQDVENTVHPNPDHSGRFTAVFRTHSVWFFWRIDGVRCGIFEGEKNSVPGCIFFAQLFHSLAVVSTIDTAPTGVSLRNIKSSRSSQLGYLVYSAFEQSLGTLLIRFSARW